MLSPCAVLALLTCIWFICYCQPGPLGVLCHVRERELLRYRYPSRKLWKVEMRCALCWARTIWALGVFLVPFRGYPPDSKSW